MLMPISEQVELSGAPITVLKSGSYFGEIGLLRDTRRTATVRALSDILELFVLTKASFLLLDGLGVLFLARTQFAKVACRNVRVTK